MKRMTLLAALAVAGLLLASCSSDSDSGSDAYGGSSDTTAAESAAPASDEGDTADAADAAAGDATVAVAEVGDLGEALVDAEGMTLYLFTNDDGTTSACADACLDTWPAAVADGEPVAGEGLEAELTTADAAAPNQLVYNGHLLYTFSGDAAPGDANGAEIPNWHAVDVNGDAIEVG